MQAMSTTSDRMSRRPAGATPADIVRDLSVNGMLLLLAASFLAMAWLGFAFGRLSGSVRRRALGQ